MPLSLVDSKPALIVIDLQAGIVGIGVPGTAEVIARSATLADAFRAAGHPVVLVRVTHGVPGRSDRNPAGGGRVLPEAALPIVPELGEGDVVIQKQSHGAFHGTPLESWLAERGVTQVFLTGVATGTGVEATGREALARGLNVVTVIDAMADSDPEIHDFVVSKVFPKWSETATTDEVLAAL
ncbi:cysteine hydrolase family protein [Nocardioides sp. Kera G14]|uniref:cysteine hydrolase family protein n=1 Tax=Nocardioides sp. Kera G14 TaxID=2884264 RepID=UPI001D10A7D7|nr:isochorismatase family cysteine hydrolase [Nocardioides sp. Kera G14]UDY22629.1 cysteine hydrolase [Nocardioides sp. Kera G14]